ncbi:hypothetical protein T07_6997 [Trichinella nelsoni]|uniref:Uncharacterized protein n=1 Tax=Trichinella nelsoni TaxID=6336 RepID=A0A0V0RLT1_9BILA|nr:hypothetical protein T07_6997 [Trichinella nelsoni]
MIEAASHLLILIGTLPKQVLFSAVHEIQISYSFATAYCLLLTAAADAFAASTFAATAAFAGAAEQFTFKTLHTHQKKKLKNKLDHFITIKRFTMSKKWECHVVVENAILLLHLRGDSVLLLLCCLLYELNLFNDLLNLI